MTRETTTQSATEAERQPPPLQGGELGKASSHACLIFIHRRLVARL